MSCHETLTTQIVSQDARLFLPADIQDLQGEGGGGLMQCKTERKKGHGKKVGLLFSVGRLTAYEPLIPGIKL
jgi:hypothetical protein